MPVSFCHEMAGAFTICRLEEQQPVRTCSVETVMLDHNGLSQKQAGKER